MSKLSNLINRTLSRSILIALAGGAMGVTAMAQQNNTGTELPKKGLLVAPATAMGIIPAEIQLNLKSARIPDNAQLELSVEPANVTNDKYIVVVSTTDQAQKQIGTFAFYPPPRVGKVQKFLIDAQPLIAEAKDTNRSQFDLSVRLVPVSQDKNLAGSTLKVLGARLVGG